MPEYARLFRNGGSQAVRLPRDHRFPGDRVRITRVPGGVLLEPVYTDVQEWFAAMDAAGAGAPFMEWEREQPPTPTRNPWDDDDDGGADAAADGDAPR